MIELIDDIWFIILDYLLICPKKLKSFVDPSKLNWTALASNSCAIDFIISQIDDVYWEHLKYMSHSEACKMLNMTDYFYSLDTNELMNGYFELCVPQINTVCINWNILSSNSGAIELLEIYPKNINYNALSYNTAAMHILERDLAYEESKALEINWKLLSVNFSTIHLIECNMHRLDSSREESRPSNTFFEYDSSQTFNWSTLSMNPKAIHLIEQHIAEASIGMMPLKIDWAWLSLNPKAIHILEQNLDKIDWIQLSLNPEASSLVRKHLLEANPIKIHWDYFWGNTGMIDIIEEIMGLQAFTLEQSPLQQYKYTINWRELSANRAAIHILEQNINRICYYRLSQNIGIFKNDSEKFKKKKNCWMKKNLKKNLKRPRE